MDGLTFSAPAKLNLRLLVGPLGDDGYHPVCTLLVALDGLADTVTVTHAGAREVVCPGIDGHANLAWRALDALERHTGRSLPCRVEIDKRIPAQAGLGGGSSDAAAVLRAADRLFGLDVGPDGLESLAAEVGSDVPFFVRAGAQWAGGRGERLAPAAMPAFAALIVRPDFGLATAEVYRAFDALAPPLPDDDAPVPDGMPGLAAWIRNDLWAAAVTLRPELIDTAAMLREVGATATLLCGSGSAMAGLFDDVSFARVAAEDARGVVAVVTGAAGYGPD